jgi:hypothetical protein
MAHQTLRQTWHGRDSAICKCGLRVTSNVDLAGGDFAVVQAAGNINANKSIPAAAFL